MPIRVDLAMRMTRGRKLEYGCIAEQKAVNGYYLWDVPHKPGRFKLNLPFLSTSI
jgi:hypothetical protein